VRDQPAVAHIFFIDAGVAGERGLLGQAYSTVYYPWRNRKGRPWAALLSFDALAAGAVPPLLRRRQPLRLLLGRGGGVLLALLEDEGVALDRHFA
jgi:hypothetical protein